MPSKNKVAIITGAAKGIGRGIVHALAKENYNVIISDVDEKGCQKVLTEIIKKGDQGLVVTCDVSQGEQIQNLFAQTIKKFGRVDVVVNNAGIFPFISLDKMTEADWDKVIDVNLKSIFFTTQEAAKAMTAGGRIINISSIASFVGFAGLTHYCASKGGMNGFLRAAALELAPKNITVNGVAPGAIETPGASQPDQPRTAQEKQKQQTIAMIPLKRMGQPEDIANAVVFLASEKSSYITGQVIIVDGGWTLQ